MISDVDGSEKEMYDKQWTAKRFPSEKEERNQML